MILKIVTVPNPILRQQSKPVKTLDKKTLKFIEDLQETLVSQKDPVGVGLSAVQVGKLIRVFGTNLPQSANQPKLSETDKPKVRVFINPEIIAHSKKLTLGPNKEQPILEGCFSIPKIYGPVRRHDWIEVKFQMIDKGQLINKTERFAGFFARVIEHELDHLNGVLFTDYSLEQKQLVYEERDGKLHLVKLM